MPGQRTADTVDALLAPGQAAVTTREVAELLGVPAEHVRVRMQPLVHGGRVLSPARGLWVAIPAEYRTWRVRPGVRFIDPMMAHLNRDYDVGWLSAAEVTALDLVADPRIGGGVSNVATVLVELADENRLDGRRLADGAEHCSLAAVRRLGFLLDTVEQRALAEELHGIAEQRRTFPPDPLAPGGARRGHVDRVWRLRVNTDVEPDL